MKILARDLDGVVVAIGTDVRRVENGLFCDDTIYLEDGLSIVETAKEVAVFKNTLINDVVGINPEYTKAEEEKANSPELKIIELENKILLMQRAIDDLILNGGAL